MIDEQKLNELISNISNTKSPLLDFSYSRLLTEGIDETLLEIHEERERVKASEEAYRKESIRSLNAIEQNTASLSMLVDLIIKNNEQQDEIISIIAQILMIAKAKSKSEAESEYTKVMGRITQTIKDAETLAKIVGMATAVWQLVKPILDKLPI